MTSCNRRLRQVLVALAALSAARVEAAPPAAAREDFAQAAARIDALTPEEKVKLLQKKERFDALSVAERDQLRKLHSELTSQPDGDRMFGVLKRYNNWLKTLTSAQQAELMELPIDKRLAKIKELQRSQIESHFLDLSFQLEKEDIHTIYAWMEDFVTRRQDEILAKMDPRSSALIVSNPNPHIRRYLLVRAVFAFRRSQNESPPLTPTEADFSALATQLSPTLQYELSVQKSDENRRSLVMACARYSFYARYAPPPPSDDELRRFYTTLKAEERERVEKLEPRQMRRELIQLYNRNRFRGGWRPPGAAGEPGPGKGLPPGGGPAFSPPAGGPPRRDGSRLRPRQPETPPKDDAPAEPPEKS
jgi:hypothetical protein